jgi:hypothetical protein
MAAGRAPPLSIPEGMGTVDISGATSGSKVAEGATVTDLACEDRHTSLSRPQQVNHDKILQIESLPLGWLDRE